MAVSFNNAKGEAKKGVKADYYKYVDGDNVIRLIGGVLPRYLYWVKGTNDKNIPFECLAFNREIEEFDRVEPDHVQEMFPDLKCGWSYAMLCLDNGKVKVLSLKKKLFQQIMTAAEDLGDPTDPETGLMAA